MIILRRSGVYKLIETRHQTKILYLDRKAYAWIQPQYIGEILVASHKPHKTDCILSIGDYCIYDVADEPSLSDLQHLELDVGCSEWQGYLLPTGLPRTDKKRVRIIPTHEIITTNPYYYQDGEVNRNFVASR